MLENQQSLREKLVECGQALGHRELSVGKSGNVSARLAHGCLITPSGVDYQQLAPADMVEIGLDGARGKHPLSPSSEWQFHTAIYRHRAEVNAIVHAHPTYCTALACTGRNIPAFHYMVAVAGGEDIPLAPYALFGTESLSRLVVTALEKRRACLMANHGLVTLGHNLDAAFQLALEVENLARQYCAALSMGGVRLLSSEQMRAALDKFAGYGQRVGD